MQAFDDTTTCARARARLSDALAAGHPAILLLGDDQSLVTALLSLVASDLAAAGQAVRHLGPDNVRPAALAHADPRVLVAIDRVDLLSRPALLALEDHLRLPGTRLLLAGRPSFRDRTATSGLMTLHFAPLVVGLPGPAPGDPHAFERSPRARRLARVTAIAEARPIAAILDRPLAALAASAALAILAAALAAPVSITRPAATWNAAPVSLPPIADGLPSVGGGNPPATQLPGIIVDRVDPDALVSPRIVHALPGDTLRSAYERIYRGLDAPPFDAVASLNRHKVVPGTRLVFPAPAGGWPAR